MAEDGETKDDVRVPDGDIGDKINKLFTEEEKDTSKYCIAIFLLKLLANYHLFKMLSSLPPWVSKPASKLRRLQRVLKSSTGCVTKDRSS